MRHVITALLIVVCAACAWAQQAAEPSNLEESVILLDQRVNELEQLRLELLDAKHDVETARETGNRVIFFCTMIVGAMSLLTLVIVGMFAIRLLHENAEFQQMREDVRLIRALQDTFSSRLEAARAEAVRQIENLASQPEEPSRDVRARMTTLGQTISALERVTGTESDATSLFTKGVELLNVGDMDGAVEQMSRAIGKKPDFPEAYVYLGAAYLQKGRTTSSAEQYDRAIRAFEAALANRPGYAVAKVNLGVAHMEKGVVTGQQELIAEAVRDCQEAVEMQPDYPRAHFHLARSLARAGRDGDALASLGRAIELDATYAERAGGEPAFENMRETAAFRELTGGPGTAPAP